MDRDNKGRFVKGHKAYLFIDGRSNASPREKWDRMEKGRKAWCEGNNIHRIPFGCVVHHLDGNPFNNSFENLQILDRKTHEDFHSILFRGGG